MRENKNKNLDPISIQKKRDLLAAWLKKKTKEPQKNPLSYGQKALWFLQNNHPATCAYNAAYCLRILSSIDCECLKKTFQLLIDRHPILRTTYELDNGEPAQITHPEMEVDFDVYDVSAMKPVQVDSAVQETYRIPFNLETGPIARVRLFSISEMNHILMLTIHHIACDAWSMWILMNEFRQIYPALRNGETANLPALNHTYFDFVQWQKNLTEGKEGTRLWEFWQNRLEGDIPVLDLPTDAPYPPARNYHGSSVPFRLSTELIDSVHARAREQGATLYMALLAAFQVLLHRYAGQTDIIVGSPTSGRTQADFASLVGYYVNPVALRSTIEGDPIFSDYLGQIRHVVLDALTHQDYPLPLLAERLPLNRDPSRTPLFQAMFILQKPPQSDEFLELMTPGAGNVHWGGLDLQPYELPQMEGQFDLTLEILEKAEQRDGLFGVVKFNTDVFDDHTIRRFQTHYRVLLEAIAADPDRPISKLPLLSSDEKTKIVVEWNQTDRPYRLDRCLHEWIEDQAARVPDAPAVVALPAVARLNESDAPTQLTYDELNRSANRLAHYLREKGVGRDAAVGVYAERSIEMVAALLGILKAGGAYVPLDPSLPKERIQHMLDNANIKTVLTHQSVSPPYTALQKMDETIHWISLDEDPSLFSEFSDANPTRINHEDDLAYVIYTSGSTGKPKGAMNTHRAICNRLLWMQEAYSLTEDDRVFQKTPYSFDVSVWEFFWPLMTGARMVLAKPGGHKDNAYLIDAIQAQGITTMHFVPSMLKPFLEWDGVESCKALRRVICSGEALSVENQTRFFEKLDCELHNLYGPTEAAVDVTFWKCEANCATHTVPIGRPIANTQIYILDPKMQPVPIGVCGELHIGGAGLARGYINNPELTRERFVPDPFSNAGNARLYKTGDVARHRFDGVIEYIGRSDFQEKIRGFRIEPGEIECELEQIDSVLEAAVLARDDRPGGKYLAAYVAARDGRKLDMESLKSALLARLPDYMVPSVFVELPALPKLNNGKLDRTRLPSPAENETPSLRSPDNALSGIEKEIHRIWTDVLERDGIGLRDNFFEAGGHSLLLGHVQKRLKDQLNLTVAMVELFQYPTIQSLADYLDNQKSPAGRPRLSQQPLAGAERAEIAVVGMAGRFPGAKTVDEFWENLCQGNESISHFTREEMIAAGADERDVDDPEYVNAFGLMDEVEQFDASFFGVTAREAEVMDAQRRVFLECAWTALENAGCDPGQYPGKIGVFAGTGLSSYLLYHVMPNADAVRNLGEFQAMISNDKDYLPTFASYKLNLKGPSVSIQTACSTSLVSIHYACQSLRDGECDMALAGGVSIHLPQRKGYRFQEGMILSPDGHCRAFDAQAQGTVGGDGAGIVALKRLDDAVRDGDTIHAVIAGSAINNDGALKAGYTAPSVDGQADVIESALAQSRLSPDDIGYVEAHGTGTVLGDPIEVKALNMAYGGRAKDSRCAIGSVKTNVGHLDAAAGVAGFIKAALCVSKGKIPPSLHYQNPNPQIDFESTPFYVNDALAQWKTEGRPRCAAVSSFGIGGTNAHVVLKEGPDRPQPDKTVEPFLLPISAKCPNALRQRAEDLAQWLPRHAASNMGNISNTLCLGRKPFEYRGYVVASTAESAVSLLRKLQPCQCREELLETAFLFPGQGAQYPGMGRHLYHRFSAYRKAVDQCCEIVKSHLGGDLHKFLSSQPSHDGLADELRQTSLAQPAIFIVEYAVACLWISLGIKPVSMIGHSIGEYAAACLSGVFALEDALRLVAARGAAMQQASPGSMLAVSLGEENCQPYLDGSIHLAAVNGPEQCVLSGDSNAVERLAQRLAAKGIQAQELKTSHAFHSPMMETAAKLFEAHVAATPRHAPTIPFVSNLTGTWITDGQAVDPGYWRDQLRCTVRFGDGVKTLLGQKAMHLIEAGPGTTLISLARQSGLVGADLAAVSSLPHPSSDMRGDEAYLSSVGHLWSLGMNVDWNALIEKGKYKRVPLPEYPFQRKRHWLEAKPRQTGSISIDDSLPLLRKPSVKDWLYRPGWIECDAVPENQAAARAKICFAPNRHADPMMDLLAETWGNQEAGFVSVHPGETFQKIDDRNFTVNPSNRDDLSKLFRALNDAGFSFQEIIIGWLGEPGLDSDALRKRGFFHLIALAQTLAEEGMNAELQVIAITQGMVSVAGETSANPDMAMALGAIRTIPLEYPNLECRCIDVEPFVAHLGNREAAARRLALEIERPKIEHTKNERFVALRGDARWIPNDRTFALETASNKPVFRHGGAYAITGGLGGVGLAIAKRLAERYQAKLILIGRSAFPHRKDWNSIQQDKPYGKAIQALKEMEAQGASVLAIQADVANLGQTRDAIAKAEKQFGKVHGVIHAAGASPSGVIQRKTVAGMNEVIQGKVDGAKSLHLISKESQWDFLALFSSLATSIEEIGQADYFAANAYLDAMAGLSPIARVINWDTWNESGMAARADMPEEMRLAHQERLALGLNDDEGFEALEACLQSGRRRVIISTQDLARRRAAHLSRIESSWKTKSQKPMLNRQETAPPRSSLEQDLCAIWQELIGVEPIGVHDDFFALGGHSLLATQALSRIRNHFSIQLTMDEFFLSCTVEKLAQIIVSKEAELANEDDLNEILNELTEKTN